MINKLPEIGARYRRIKPYNNKYFNEIKVIGINRVDGDQWVEGEFTSTRLKVFLEKYEPIHKEQDQEEIMQAHEESGKFGEVKDKVQEAMEDLKYHLQINEYYNKSLALDEIKFTAQKLINALENTSKKADNLPMKEDRVDDITELYRVLYNQSFAPELEFYLDLMLRKQEQNTKETKELKQMVNSLVEVNNKILDVNSNLLDRVSKLEQLNKG